MQTRLREWIWTAGAALLVLTNCATTARYEDPLSSETGTCLRPGERYQLSLDSDGLVLATPENSYIFESVVFRPMGRCALLNLEPTIKMPTADRQQACVQNGSELPIPALHRRTASCRIAGFGDRTEMDLTPMPGAPPARMGLGTFVSDQEVQDMRDELLVRLLSNAVVSDNAGHTSRLRRIAEKLQLKRNEVAKTQIFVVETDDLLLIDFDENRIAASTGLVDLMTNDELAFLLAVEMAHRTYRHDRERFRRFAYSGDESAPYYEILGSAGAVTKDVLPYSRNHQLEADQSALHRVNIAGFQVNSAPRALEKLANRSQRDSTDYPWIAINPIGVDRITKLLSYGESIGLQMEEPWTNQ